MPVRVCVVVRESSTARAAAAAGRAAAWADIVEVRADYIRDLDLRTLFSDKPCPILFTLRPQIEGGHFVGTEAHRLETLLEAAGAGADYVDIEFAEDWERILREIPAERVIVSSHNFLETPADLDEKLEQMARTRAGTLKIVTRARRLTDNIVMARLLKKAAEMNVRLIALALGREGIPSRILAPVWGSWMTYAEMPGALPDAEGQIAADVIHEKFRIRSVSADTKLFGVLGRPLGHSLSPWIHNSAFKAREIDALYLPLEAASIEDFLRFDEFCPFDGVSVTLPYKEAAFSMSRELSESAKKTGAVNTLLRESRGWRGENTDVSGFLLPLRDVPIAGKEAVVLGAGGAARAAVHGLQQKRAHVRVVARNRSAGEILARDFGIECHPWESLSDLRWSLLVNATPVGMAPRDAESPVTADQLTGEWVYDLVYNPVRTRLLREAGERGCKTVSGLEMFLGQAVQQQGLWLGPGEAETPMRVALLQALGVDPTGGTDLPGGKSGRGFALQ